MKNLKGLQRTIMASAIAVLAFGAAPAKAVTLVPVPTPVGACTGVAGTNDCSTAVGHIGVSVIGTLSINEKRAISFGNMHVKTIAAAAGDATLVLSDTGALTPVAGANTDLMLLLHGVNATGGPGAAGADGQAPGHYTVADTDNPVGVNQIYISFADATTGAVLDCNGDSNFPGNVVAVVKGAAHFNANAFTFTEAGNDVYGHFVAGTLPIDVAVGATLKTVAGQTYALGKYVGVFNIIASY